MTIAEDRVQTGARMLDEQAPGWDALIDLTVLDLGSPQYCVLGQLDRAEGGSGNFVSWLQKHYNTEVVFVKVLLDGGFAGNMFLGRRYPSDVPDESELTQAWKEEIARRRGYTSVADFERAVSQFPVS